MTKAREIVRELEADGWFLIGSKGSHYQFKHPSKQGKVTVPFHGSGDLYSIRLKI